MASRAPTFALGVDLGTTNTVLAYAPLGSDGAPAVFPVRQRIAEDLHEARLLLPSFLAHGGDGAWEVGTFARERHARDPDAVVASSKSWLTEPRVDRTAAFLPLATDIDLDAEASPRLAPAEAQALVLRAVAAAWDAEHPEAPFAEQAVVVTIPASFDPFARDLVLGAARAVARRATLLEEPTAALLHVGERRAASLLAQAPEALVLVADVGGGTTDFALVRVLRGARGPLFERVATGRHLLLGGDNVDLALAHRVAEAHEPLRNLAPHAFAQLVAECRRAKEVMLGDPSREGEEVRVLLPGSKLVGGLRTGAVPRAMVDACVLREFFPMPAELAPKPARSAFVGFGLSYERDAAITRHAWEFLERHRDLLTGPLHLLPNGGSLKAAALVERLAEALRAFGAPIAATLPGDDGDLAVALGAAAHARALAEGASRLRGRVARNLFLRVQRGAEDAYLAIVAAGSAENEEQRVDAGDLALRTGERARFELGWCDGAPVAAGMLAPEVRAVERLPALTVAVPAAASPTVPVSLRVRVDELGCVHLACVSPALAEPLACTFETRAKGSKSIRQARLDPAVVPLVRAVEPLLDAAFPESVGEAGGRAAKDLWRALEGRLGPRKGWSLSLCRALHDALATHAKARRKSAEHERVFWHLAGFTLRPGLGADGDDERVDRLFKLEQERIAHAEDARAWEAYFHAWRRVSLGLDARRQAVVFERGELALGVKKQKKPCPHGFDGALAELVGALDRVEPRRRAALGDALFDRCMGGDGAGHLRRALGLLGERDPFPAGHDQALPAMVVERWCDLALRENWSMHPAWIDAVGRMARLTRDRRRDVSGALRERLLARLATMPAAPGHVEAVAAIAEGATPNVRTRLESSDDAPLGLLLEG
jgi:hypothetical protein